MTSRAHRALSLRAGALLIAVAVAGLCVGGVLATPAHADPRGCAPPADGHAVCKTATKSDSPPAAVLPAIGLPSLADRIVPAAAPVPAARLASRAVSPLGPRSPPAR
jgi:hypothetical protein